MTSVSVVIATRNRRLLLSEAVATVREQTFEDWELLVVDDDSTDDTASFLRTVSDPRIRFMQQRPHGERSAARNRGLVEAIGEFIMFLDDDDLLRPRCLERLGGALRARPDAVAATGGCRIFRPDADSVKVYHPPTATVRDVGDELLFGWWANSGQNLYRTAVVRQVGGYDPALAPCEDRKLWLAIAACGPVFLEPHVAMDYRQHAGQSKPANLEQIRQSVWTAFIGALPPAKRARAIRVRHAGELAAHSEVSRAAGRFGPALRQQLKACLSAPHLLTSPLVGRPLWWGVKKCMLRVSSP